MEEASISKTKSDDDPFMEGYKDLTPMSLSKLADIEFDDDDNDDKVEQESQNQTKVYDAKEDDGDREITIPMRKISLATAEPWENNVSVVGTTLEVPENGQKLVDHSASTSSPLTSSSRIPLPVGKRISTWTNLGSVEGISLATPLKNLIHRK